VKIAMGRSTASRSRRNSLRKGPGGLLRTIGSVLKHITSGLRYEIRGRFPAERWDFGVVNGAAISHAPTIEPSTQNPLEQYCDAHTIGPGIWKWRHYFDIYHRHFQKFIGREVHLMEIGIYSGGSLDMWKHYFGPGCTVYGVDIQPECMGYEGERTKIFIGDQADRGFWRETLQKIPKLDIIIDDGGHEAHQQIATLEETLPALAPGGVYVCEDLHGRNNKFTSYCYGLSHGLNASRFTNEEVLASYATPFQQFVQSIHFYPFVVVIERTTNHEETFEAPKHGTQWQPFGREWRCQPQSDSNSTTPLE